MARGHLPQIGARGKNFQRECYEITQCRWATLRPTCWAAASGTSPSTVTSCSPMGRAKKVVVPSSLEASVVRGGAPLGSTNTETLASPSL